MTFEDSIINTAKTWIGTPYHHHAKVKGAGVDCIQLVVGVYEELGLVDGVDTGTYSTDWYFHKDQDLYLEGVERYLRPVDDLSLSIRDRIAVDPSWRAPRASLGVFRFGRTFSHGVIFADWPMAIHASQPARIVEEVDVLRSPLLVSRSLKLYTYQETVS